MASDRRFFLDRRVAFVNAIFRIIDGERAYDEAINTLVAAERRHGLRIIHDAVGGSPALALIPARKDARLTMTMREIIDLNSDTDRLWAYYRDAPYERAEDENKKYPFPFISRLSSSSAVRTLPTIISSSIRPAR